MKRMLDVQNLNYNIKKIKILDNVSFNIPAGKICAFLGKNGAGKSTTIKCILSLIKNYSAKKINCNGQSTKFTDTRKLIGYAPEHNLLPKMTSLNFLLEQAAYVGLSKSQAQKQIKILCEALDFSYERLNISVSDLSSGLQKVIVIIQSLLGNPKLLIMDEPTMNLDFETRLLFYKLIMKLKSKGMTFFISTHNFYEIRQFAN
jgi:ABC-2 type transport system ATP-binding protein